MRPIFAAQRLSYLRRMAACAVIAALCGSAVCAAQKKLATKTAPDVLVLSNGDILHGTLVSEAAGKVTFNSSALGNVTLPWNQIKDLRTSGDFAVLNSTVMHRGRKSLRTVPVGALTVANQAITVHPVGAPALAPIPITNAAYILDEATLDRQMNHTTGIFAGWNGSTTAGATLVTATQNQYTFSGGVSLARIAPTVAWLEQRNRTLIDFSGSFGKITQPAYISSGTLVAAVVTKTAIYHAAAENDEYFSPRFFALQRTAFDHNFSQNLDLQQIYGGGLGWTAIKTPRQEGDLKAALQYEKQQFIQGGPGSNQNLIASTFGADYALHLKIFTYTQSLDYIPAYNNLHAYSITETNQFTFPTYKNLGFSLGTLDSYLNNPPISLPPTKRNSFQFTMGLTYTIK